MIATRFRAVVWAAGVAAAAVSCYLVSLQVAAERAQLMKTERRIIAARQDIRQLRTELDTRARLVQLERWNADVLGLQAPQVTQYAAGAVELASYVAPRGPAQVMQAVATPQPTPAAPAVVQVAARVATPQPPAPVAAPRPALRQATFIAPAGGQPLLQKASLTMMSDPAPAPVPAARAPRPATTASLLGDDVLGDIGREADRESRTKGR